jgi:hypothetical protein
MRHCSAASGSADTLELALLQDAQQLRLRRRRQLPDLVEEDGAVPAISKRPFFCSMAP